MQQQEDRSFLIIVGIVIAVFAITGIGVFSGAGILPRGTSRTNSNKVKAENTGQDINSSGFKSIQVNNAPKGIFNYGGSTTWIPIHEPISDAISESFPEFELRYTMPANGLPGSGSGVQMLLDQQLSIAESSRPLKTSEYETAQKRGFNLEQIEIAIDGIAVAVHPDLKLPGLSVDQLKQIYTGQATNWSSFGGPNIPIKAYSKSPEKSGTAEYVLKSLLDADSYGSNVEYVSETTPTLRKVSSTPGSIYYASAPEVVNQCSIYAMPIAPHSEASNFISPYEGAWKTGEECLDQANTVNKVVFREGQYPLTRQLFVIVRDDDTQNEEAGRFYGDILLSPEGQTLVEQAGFISIR